LRNKGHAILLNQRTALLAEQDATYVVWLCKQPCLLAPQVQQEDMSSCSARPHVPLLRRTTSHPAEQEVTSSLGDTVLFNKKTGTGRHVFLLNRRTCLPVSTGTHEDMSSRGARGHVVSLSKRTSLLVEQVDMSSCRGGGMSNSTRRHVLIKQGEVSSCSAGRNVFVHSEHAIGTQQVPKLTT